MDRALTCLILFSVPCVPGAHELTRVFRVIVNGRQDILTKEHKHTLICKRAKDLHCLQNQQLGKASEWSQFRNRGSLPKFIVSIEALRLHIVNCKETTKHQRIIDLFRLFLNKTHSQTNLFQFTSTAHTAHHKHITYTGFCTDCCLPSWQADESERPFWGQPF